MKKIISVLLAAIMCFSTATVCFAAEDETTEVSKDSITEVLLEAAKIAANLNDELRKKLSDELEGLIIEQIVGDNPILQKAVKKILDKAIEISGADNILTLSKEQAEKIAEFLTKMYDGNISDYIDSPFVKLIVSFIPEEVFKEAVIWILSDGFGDAIKDFINKYGDGESAETPSEPEQGSDSGSSIDWGTVLSAAYQALVDVVKSIISEISGVINPQPAA